jgi:hypothetical protein
MSRNNHPLPVCLRKAIQDSNQFLKLRRVIDVLFPMGANNKVIMGRIMDFGFWILD